MKSRSVPVIAAIAGLVGAGSTAPSTAEPLRAAATGAPIPMLTIGGVGPVTTLDMTKTDANGDIDDLALDSLLKLGPDGQVEPYLATSWAQPNAVTYVYHLRHGVRFWDGNEMTAADVAYSLNYERAPSSQAAIGFASVKHVTASGPFTVVVTLTHPDAAWQYTLGAYNARIFEMKFAQAHKGTFGAPGTLVMGSGPWEIDSLDPTTGAELSANPDWWGGKVAVQHISYKFFSTETSEALAFRAGEVDFAEVGDPQSFASTSGAKLLTTPSCDEGLFSMNTQSAPWDDVHVRRAVAYALKRADIVVANGGYATADYTLIPPSMLLTVASHSQVNSLLKALPRYPYDLAKAKAEMAESAYPHGFSAVLLGYNSGDIINIEQVIIAELEKIGINLHIKDDSIAAWGALETGPASKRVAAFAVSGCQSPDPSEYTYLLGSWNTKSGEWNLADYAPAAVDQLINAGVATTNPARRFAIYSKILQNLQTDVPYVGLFVDDISVALSTKFAIPGYNAYSFDTAYPLLIKPAS